MNNQTLNAEEKIRIVLIIIETIDTPIEFEEFQEILGLLGEDIPGLEDLSDEDFSMLVNDCWECFQQVLLSKSDNQ
jgi:hypothetical protein